MTNEASETVAVVHRSGGWFVTGETWSGPWRTKEQVHMGWRLARHRLAHSPDAASNRVAEWVLPDLPRPAVKFADHSFPAFSVKQMQEYALAMLSAAPPPPSDARADDEVARLRKALERIAVLTPERANAFNPRDLHLTVRAIAETALSKDDVDV